MSDHRQQVSIPNSRREFSIGSSAAAHNTQYNDWSGNYQLVFGSSPCSSITVDLEMLREPKCMTNGWHLNGVKAKGLDPRWTTVRTSERNRSILHDESLQNWSAAIFYLRLLRQRSDSKKQMPE